MRLHQATFRSGKYWEQRYRRGGTSGAGSYNRLAEFKAEFLNGFVEREQVRSVLEFGCGDGAQLQLARYPTYIGVDVSASALRRCRSIFEADASKSFLHTNELAEALQAELTISLDVIYHLVESDIFETYMRDLFRRASRFVIVYSSNRDGLWSSEHVRHRKFTAWVEQNAADWELLSMTPNRYPYDDANPDQTSFADFYVFARRAPRN